MEEAVPLLCPPAMSPCYACVRYHGKHDSHAAAHGGAHVGAVGSDLKES